MTTGQRVRLLAPPEPSYADVAEIDELKTSETGEPGAWLRWPDGSQTRGAYYLLADLETAEEECADVRKAA